MRRVSGFHVFLFGFPGRISLGVMDPVWPVVISRGAVATRTVSQAIAPHVFRSSCGGSASPGKWSTPLRKPRKSQPRCELVADQESYTRRFARVSCDRIFRAIRFARVPSPQHGNIITPDGVRPLPPTSQCCSHDTIDLFKLQVLQCQH